MDQSIPHKTHLWPVPPSGPRRRQYRWQDVLEDSTLELARTRACFETIESDVALDYDLPRARGMMAGQIMKHCHEALNRVLEAQWPCIYKIGYTHDPSWRWHNAVYGYRWENAKWTNLLVIYASSETISPSFVEAALIQRHKGDLNACKHVVW